MMRNWFRSRTDAGDSTVPAEFRDAFDEVFKPYGGRPDLLVKLRAYVLSGSPPSFLGAASDPHLFVPVLDLWGLPTAKAAAEVWRRFYTAFNEVDTEVALRWARLIEAATHHLTPVPAPGSATWVGPLLVHAAKVLAPSHRRGDECGSLPLEYATVERMACEAGAAPGVLLVERFRPMPVSWWPDADGRAGLRKLAGYDLAVRRHAGLLKPLMAGPNVEARLTALAMLAPTSAETLCRFAAELAELATATSSQVRSDGCTLADPVR